ncbi:MAG TPA: hypothetical protein VIZ63_23575 [Povalibacter sp.]
MKTITAETREHVKMEVPHVLIAGRPIVLTRGDALTPKCLPHRARYKTGRSKEVTAKVIRNFQHVLVMKPRCDQAIAPQTSVVMQRNKAKHIRLHQDNG